MAESTYHADLHGVQWTLRPRYASILRFDNALAMKNMGHTLRKRRWSDFRSRVEYDPQSVYRHKILGWEYIPVHPFGDEPEILTRLCLRPEACTSADAWWGIDGDATLLQSTVTSISVGGCRL